MAITDTREQVVANCDSCGAIVGAELIGDGSIVPLGSAGACACGSREFRVLR